MAARLRNVHVVVPGGDLVRRRRQPHEGPRDAARHVHADEAGDEHAAAEGDRETLEENEPAAAELRRRRSDDERAEHLLADRHRLRDRKVRRSLDMQAQRRGLG